MPADSPATSASLIERLRDHRDVQAWEKLVHLYTPLMCAWLGPARLQVPDMDDLTQRVLEVVRKLPDFAHSGRPGAFRAWLRGITVNVLREFRRAAEPAELSPDTARLIEEMEDPASARLRVRQLEDRMVPSTLFVDPTGIGPGGRSAYTTIQAAVNAANHGTKIVVDPGTYTEVVTISTPGITLDGAKAGVNPVPGRSGAESVLDGYITITGKNVTVDGFTVQTSTGPWAIQVGGDTSPSAPAIDAVITDNIVNTSQEGNNTPPGIQIGVQNGPSETQVPLYALVQDNVLTTANTDIGLPSTADNTVRGNLLLMNPNQFGSGIDVYYSTNDSIVGNIIDNAPAPTDPWYFAAIKFRGDQGNLVMNNSGTGDGQPAVYQTENASNQTILNNNFPPNTAASNAGSTVLYVDPSGVGPEGVPAYTTIQAAVNAAASGQIIVVDAGTYTENVTVGTAGVSLEGAQAGINPVPGRSGAESVLDGSITITAANVTVDGFTVDSTGQWAIEVGGSSTPSLPAVRAQLIDNIVNASVYGIQIGAEGGPSTTRVNLYAVVQDNLITSSGGSNIVLFNTGGNLVEGNLLPMTTTQFGSGIDIYYANNDLILGNEIDKAPAPTSPWYFAAIKLRGAHQNLVMNNHGTGDGQPAIFATEGATGNFRLRDSFP